jgi:hypothetical protein
MGSTHNSGEHGLPEANMPAPAQVVNIAGARPALEAPEKANRFTVWLHRLSLVVFVIFCIELGMLLAVLPWTPVWVNNGILAAHPVLKSIAQANFVRGFVSGIGLVDIWLGIWEAVHYSDPVIG